LPTNLVDNVGWLREQTELPICIGFGISGPETAAQLAPVSDGLIVGSAIVRRVADAVAKAKSSGADPVKTAAEEAGGFCRSLRKAIDAA
jgi:tryptophan synthase alpha chain